MNDFRTVRAWSRAHRVVLDVYAATGGFPTRERFGLQSQVRRAAVSVAANIAEGFGRVGDGERAHFLNIAMGSASELQYHLILARDLGYLSPEVQNRLARDIGQAQRMLRSLRRRLERGSTVRPRRPR